MSSSTFICPQCSAPLKRDGACPRCMLEAGLAQMTPRPPASPGLPMISTTLGGRVPERFGDYELIEEIAHGGMGVVYLARQISLERFVALKFLLRGKHTADDLKERFRREAKAAAGLRHPNIVVVHEVGIVEDQPFFSMDFIEGRSLSEALREGPLAPMKAAVYCRTIAEAIEYAHERWVLHRDLKPSNVLIDLNDLPYVTDFGLAGKMEVRSDLTLTGQMLGSPGYLSPEQASGRMNEVTAASDIYSIGAILYECLAGRPPFLGESLQDTLLRIRDEDPVPPTLLHPGLPRDLETICLKCLEKEPARRYASASALADDLGRWIRHEPVHARPASVLGHASKWIRRNPKLSTTAAVITLALVGFIMVVALSNQFLRQSSLDSRQEADEMRRQLVQTQVRTGMQFVTDGDLAGALLWFVQAQETDDPDNSARQAEHRNRLAGMLAGLPDLKHCWPLDRAVELTHQTLALSPDGGRMAWPAADGSVQVRDIESGATVGIPLPKPTEIWCLGFNPAGDKLATLAVNGHARVWNAATGQPDGPWLNIADGRQSDDEPSLEWHPDGGSLLVALPGEPAAKVWSVAEGKLRFDLQRPSPVRWAAFVAGGSHIVTAHADNHLCWWDSRSGAPAGADLVDADLSGRRFLSADRSRLALLQGDMEEEDRRLALYDLTLRKKLLHENRKDRGLHSLAFSPDGRRFLLSRKGQASLLRDTETGALLAAGMDASSGALMSAFDDQGALVASAGLDGCVRIWQPSQDGQPLSVLRYGEDLTALHFSAGGRHLCTAGRDGVVRFWDLQSLREAATQNPPSRASLQVKDYRRLAQLMTGLELNRDGEFIPIPLETLKKLSTEQHHASSP